MIGWLFTNRNNGPPPPRTRNHFLSNEGDDKPLPCEYVILDGDNWLPSDLSYINMLLGSEPPQLKKVGWHVGELGNIVYRYVPINVPPDLI